jgi:Sad1 / UNC-like C-terminal
MKPLSSLRLVAALGGISLAAVPSLHAEFIQPVAVLASNGQDTQDALINGLGFDNPGIGSPQSVHSRDAAEMWSAVGSIKASVVFDLGKPVSLTKVYIWNYNVQDATDVGMKDVEVQVSSDSNMTNAYFNAIATISLKEGGETAQAFDVVGTNVRLVKLKGLSNWGQGKSGSWA